LGWTAADRPFNLQRQRAMPAKSKSEFFSAIVISAAMVGVLFLVLGSEIVFRLPLNRYGILPRTEVGLLGIVFSPLLHANMQHLLANAIPLFVLLVLLLSDRTYRPYRTLIVVWLASGLGTWLIGRGEAVHIGASAIIFALAAFLITAGFFLKSWRSATMALLVFIFYGGIFYGVLPHAGPISWEGHLCGAVAGIWTARNLPRAG
jgi:membrane associated rhomboid family serine protease